MTRIPVFAHFDQPNEEQIGWMLIDETKLPKTSRYLFRAGGAIGLNSGFELLEVEVTEID